MTFQIQITTGGSTPIYRQIADQIRLAVATGKLAAGDQLPSVRAQAERLVINPNTVARAYSELVQAGLVTAHQGKGLFVNGKRTIFKKAERQRRLQPALDAFVHEAVALDFTAEDIVREVQRKLSQLELPERRSGDAGDAGHE